MSSYLFPHLGVVPDFGQTVTDCAANASTSIIVSEVVGAKLAISDDSNRLHLVFG